MLQLIQRTLDKTRGELSLRPGGCAPLAAAAAGLGVIPECLEER